MKHRLRMEGWLIILAISIPALAFLIVISYKSRHLRGGRPYVASIRDGLKNHPLEIRVRSVIVKDFDDSEGVPSVLVSTDFVPQVTLTLIKKVPDMAWSRALKLRKYVFCGDPEVDELISILGEDRIPEREFVRRPEFLKSLKRLIPFLTESRCVVVLQSPGVRTRGLARFASASAYKYPGISVAISIMNQRVQTPDEILRIVMKMLPIFSEISNS